MRWLLAVILLLVTSPVIAKPVMVVMGATWCPHCRVTERNLGNLRSRPDVHVVDVDKDPKRLAEYQTKISKTVWNGQTIPLTVVVDDKDGSLISAAVGRMTTADILQMMKHAGMSLDSKE